jgi:predicted tellurium resistance membrane protein TerC
MMDAFALLLLLVGLELVLGVDNILVISIFVGKLPDETRNKARIAGLGVALLARILMLYVLIRLASLTNAVFLNYSIRDFILLAGGFFLIYKAVREIHNTVELKDEDVVPGKIHSSFPGVITQIVLMDIVFSIDSVITAIGLTDSLWVIISAVIISFMAILAFAGPIGEFIIKRPSLKILALSFLITIGVTIFLEGTHQHVPKAYIYLPMGFALLVEILQQRYEHNKEKLKRQD